jgi:23S rRNA (cytosine1962-C5)-methyltransferase
LEAGDVVDILSSEGKRLGRAGFSPDSQIRARMWTWDPDETVDEVFIQRRLENAMHYRKMVVLPEEGNAYRLVHGESDGFPGLVVDRYADTLVIQFLSAGAEGKRGENVMRFARDRNSGYL